MCDDEIHQGRVALLTRPVSAARLSAGAADGPPGAGATAAAAAVIESDVEVRTADGTADAVLLHPTGAGPWPAVLVWPDALGLRPVFRDMGRRLAAEGYVVLVPNPYYRVRPAPVLEDGFDFSDPENRARLTPLMAGVTTEGTAVDAVAFVEFLDAQPQTDRARPVGVQGYCMGGALSVRTAAAVPGRVGAVASFHGGRLAIDRPSSPHLLIPATKAEYLIAVADNDDEADPAAKETLKTALADAGRPGKVEVYTGAAHGWTVADSQVYDEPAAEKAWGELLSLYERALSSAS
jgi:carboxymethylenebutenolidase